MEDNNALNVRRDSAGNTAWRGAPAPALHDGTTCAEHGRRPEGVQKRELLREARLGVADKRADPDLRGRVCDENGLETDELLNIFVKDRYTPSPTTSADLENETMGEYRESSYGGKSQLEFRAQRRG
eukprot:1730147-Heterocapsa_arctica.AAC.1